VNAPRVSTRPVPTLLTAFLAQARSLSSPSAFVIFRNLLFLQDSRREAVVQASVVQDWEVDPSEIDMKKSIPIGKVGLLLPVKSRLLEGRFQSHGCLVSGRCISCISLIDAESEYLTYGISSCGRSSVSTCTSHPAVSREFQHHSGGDPLNLMQGNFCSIISAVLTSKTVPVGISSFLDF
jgi:hypothetical protein